MSSIKLPEDFKKYRLVEKWHSFYGESFVNFIKKRLGTELPRHPGVKVSSGYFYPVVPDILGWSFFQFSHYCMDELKKFFLKNVGVNVLYFVNFFHVYSQGPSMFCTE